MQQENIDNTVTLIVILTLCIPLLFISFAETKKEITTANPEDIRAAVHKCPAIHQKLEGTLQGSEKAFTKSWLENELETCVQLELQKSALRNNERS